MVCEMKGTTIANGRYKYVHDVNNDLSEAMDVHHIIVQNNRSGGLVFCVYALLFVVAFFPISFLLQGNTMSALLGSFVFAGFLLRRSRGKQVEKESVMILPAFGVQLETTYRSGRKVRRFVPIDMILKPVLNECVTPVTCYSSLSLIIRGADELLVVFKAPGYFAGGETELCSALGDFKGFNTNARYIDGFAAFAYRISVFSFHTLGTSRVPDRA